jgi:hypothetical protein
MLSNGVDDAFNDFAGVTVDEIRIQPIKHALQVRHKGVRVLQHRKQARSQAVHSQEPAQHNPITLFTITRNL